MKRARATEKSFKKLKKFKKTNADSVLDDDEEINIRKLLDGMKEGVFFDDLKLFIRKAAQSPEITSLVINSGVKPLEIVEIIKSNEKASSNVTSSLYEMLKMVVIQLSNEGDNHHQNISDALKYLIRKNGTSIEMMLISTVAHDKIIIFELLTFCLRYQPEFASDILKHVTFFTKPDDVLEQMRALKSGNKGEDFSLVRNSFVIMMIELISNTHCGKRIVLKNNLLQFFLEGLHNDSNETVRNIIICLTEKVLLSGAFSKPDKLRIFTEEIIKNFLKVYELKSSESVDEKVVLVHEFLIRLLTNKKQGIALSKYQNQRQSHVIGSFKSIWMKEYPSKLVIEIIKACPDLMQIILSKIANGLMPIVSAKWFMCANFTQVLLNSFDPEDMMSFLSGHEAKKVSSNIIKLSIPQFVLQNLGDNALIQQDSLEMREKATELLQIMLEKCCQYIRLLPKITTLKDYEQHRVKFDIINHIFTFFPSIETILNSLYRSINSKKGKTKEGEIAINSQLKHTVNILLLLVEHFPSVIEKASSVIDFLDVLRPVYEKQQQQSGTFDQDELEIEMNIAKIILFLKPELFTLKSDLLHKLFYFLMKVYAGGEKRSFEARDLLISLLKNNYKVFAENTIEIMVWIESLRKCSSPKVLQESTTLFVKALHLNDDDDLPLISRILSMECNKLERVTEFIEKTVILLYFVYPEKRKSYSSLIKKSAASFSSEMYSCFNEIEVIAQMTSLGPFSKLQLAISNESEFPEAAINDSNQLLLLALQVIFNAIKLSKSDALSNEKIESLTNLVKKFYEKAKIIEDNCETNEEIYDDSTTERKSEKITELMASHIFMHQETLLSKFSIAKTHQISKFVENLTEIFKEVPNFDGMLSKYRSKILSELEESPKSMERFYKTFSNFKLDGDDCIKVLDLCVSNSQADIHLISLLLNRLIERKTTFLAAKHCKFIETTYTDALEKESENIKELEEAILNYLVTFPHNIRDFSTQIFTIACKKNHNFTIRRSFVSLNILLLQCKPECSAIFASQFANIRKEIAYPLLSCVIEKQIVPLEKITSVFQKEYKSVILKALERPKKVAAIYRDFIETTLQLIDIGMSPNECFDFTQKKIKFDGSEVFQLKILQSIFTKAIACKDNEEAKEAVFVKFIDVWLNLFEQRLSASSMEGICEYTKIMDEWISKFRACKSEVDGETLSKVYKMCLKNGLKNLEHVHLLHTIAQIMNCVKVDADLAFEMFDLLVTHSQFFSIAFSAKTSEINRKRDLFFIYAVLLKKNPQIASKKQVPILLSSYNATMLQSDQLILKLLRFYEHECGIDLWDYRPYFYGSAALHHFSNPENTDEKSKAKNLGKTEADAIKLLETFEKSVVENTINNFPAQRKYDSINDEIKVQPCEVANNNRIYDPAFYLPIFEMIISTTSVNFSWQSIKNSFLELVVLSLSCEDDTLRLIAAKILLKCRQQTESKGTQKEIWVKFYDNLQKGLNDFKEQTKAKGFPKMPTIVARMLAEFTKILSKKLDNSYNTVCNYLIMKEKMDLTTIPEYLTFYQSNLPQHEEHALLLVSSIFYGIKNNLDVKVLTTTPIPKLMLTSFKGPLSTRKVDYLILKTIDRLLATVDGGGSKVLLDKYGIAMWLFHQSESLEAFEYDTIEMIITMIHNIVSNHKVNDENSKNFLRSLLKLLPKLTKSKFSPDLLQKYLLTINKLQKFTFVKLQHIELILNLAKPHLSKEQTHFLNYLLKNPEISSWKVEKIHSHEQNSNSHKIHEEIKKIIAQTNIN